MFDDVDLIFVKLGKIVDDKNKLISNLLLVFDEIDFCFKDIEIDIFGDVYEYMIGEFVVGVG